MKSITKKTCLVLNKDWRPCNIVTVKRAIVMALKGRGKFVHPKTLQNYTFYEWIQKGVESRDPDEIMRTNKECFDVPTIVLAIYYTHYHPRYTPLTRQNIYKRDDYKCYYCNNTKNLTLDHIVPESKGGKWTWTNLITCCKDCNNDKDNMSVEEFCQLKGKEVPRPISLAHTPWLLGIHNIKEEWKQFLRNNK